MKLEKYKVTNFRSVQDSGWIDCDDVTTLVGINESGKSNLLLALWKLNPAREGKIDILHDMPVSKLSTLRNIPDEVEFISAEFILDLDSAEKISEVAGSTCSSETRVVVSRYYDGNYSFDFPGGMPEPIEDVKNAEDYDESQRRPEKGRYRRQKETLFKRPQRLRRQAGARHMRRCKA